MVGLSNKARRFPPPWTIDEANDACFIVRDATGQNLSRRYLSRTKLIEFAVNTKAQKWHKQVRCDRTKLACLPLEVL